MKDITTILLILAALFLWQWSSYDANARLRDQAKLLASIEALHTADTSTFVAKWQAAHADPTSETVSDLTIIAARLKSDPSQAKALTASIRPEQTVGDAVGVAKGWLFSKVAEEFFLLAGLMSCVAILMFFAVGRRF
jgi:hypothetical protein